MLTADLVRATTRGGLVRPLWLPATGPGGEAARARAAELIDLFVAHVGRRRGDLDEAVEARIAGRPDPKLDRGLVKLLEDRSTFRGLAADEAAAGRAAVFAAAAAARRAGAFDRAAVLATAAAARATSPGRVDEDLYGDLRENEVLEAFEGLGPDELVERYNLSLAQAVLLRAQRLVVTVDRADPPRLRQLVRHVKFHGLLQTARRDGDRVVLELDGPLSIFSATPRYGVRMAGFLPALLLCDAWTLDAEVQLGHARQRRRFLLDPSAGLRTRARDAGAWLPELVEAFERRFAEVAPEWEVDRTVPLLNLGGEVVVPDFRFVHRETGYEACLEVLGYWRRGAVARRLEALRAHGAPRLVLALDPSLKVGAEQLRGLEGPVVSFREVPDARKVRKALDALRAGPPSSGRGRRR
jgi:predicted nuclease of restriction endonuclease-like RecB superfamily